MKSIPEVGGLSNQRVSALVRQLVADGVLKREEIKRKAYFSLA
jgi:DNA-binding transcriptional regulator GbsR (MarR family)